MASKNGERWILEVIRGLEPGSRFLLRDGESLLGNALGGVSGVDLARQEAPGSPRRMAGKQASLSVSGGALAIRDLESPGGTFVNRQRLFVGQARPLQPGDVIQVGGVQLQVKRAAEPHDVKVPATPASPPPVARPAASSKPTSTTTAPPQSAPARGNPGTLSQPFAIPGGVSCKSWDDFLTLAAQRWSVLREELTSGRLSAHLRQIGRADLVPRLEPGATADDQLDAWLARLPTSLSSAPELDVHPAPLVIRSALGGGSVRQTLRITNVGYRLLRSTAKVESVGPARIRLAPELSGRPFTTIDQTDLNLEIDLPEGGSATVLGAVVVESNGGSRRVEVRLERPASGAGIPAEPSAASAPLDLSLVSRPLLERIEAMPLGHRLAYAAGTLVFFRLLILLACQLPPLGGPPASGAEPRLNPIVLVLACGGLSGGLLIGAGAGGRFDRLAAGFAGAAAGVFAGAIGYALIRSGESLLGPWAGSSVAVLTLWALFGVALALLSWVLRPTPRSREPEPSLTTSASPRATP